MPVAIDAVLFDFGGVFTPSPFDVVEVFATERGHDPAQLLEITFGPYHEDTNHPWHRLERGEVDLLSTREAIGTLAAQAGIELDFFDVLRAMASGPGPFVREAMVARTRSIRQTGRKTALVTNNAAEFGPSWRPLLPLEELFDAVVDSSDVGLRKPDPRIYHLALERLGGVAPDRAVFLDDFEGNVRAARDLGMAGIVVADPDEAIARLDSLLGGA